MFRISGIIEQENQSTEKGKKILNMNKQGFLKGYQPKLKICSTVYVLNVFSHVL